MKTTDPQCEMLIEVDKNNKVLGKISRKKAHINPDKFYRTISVFIKNNNNQYLFHKRSATKDLYPNCWDFSVGGHVPFGSSYIDTAVREINEELGLRIRKKELKFKGEVLVKLPFSNEFFHVFEYLLRSEDKIKVEKHEIAKTEWMSLSEVKTSIKNKTKKWYERPLQIIKAIYY